MTELEDILRKILLDAIRPTDIDDVRAKRNEKKTAPIELYEDELDEAYDMSKDIREYE